LFGSNPTFESGVDIQSVYYPQTGQAFQSSAIPLANCYDLGHGHSNFVKEYANGAMTGFGAKASAGCNVGANPAVRFVQQSDVQPYFDIATAYGWANRMFQTNEGASFAAHQFLLSGTSSPSEDSPLFAADNPTRGRGGCIGPADSYIWLINPDGKETTSMFPCFERPTLTDLLNAANVTWKWYAPNAKSIWTAPDAVNHMCVPKNGVCTGTDFANVILKPTQITSDITADSYADDLSSFFPKSNPRTFVQINAKQANFEKMPLEDPDTD
jgi:phospholipase C